MIDLILQGTKANITSLLKARGLLDASNNPVPGCEMTWWAGDGKFMKSAPVVDGFTVTTPATFLTGFVLMVRIHGPLREADMLAAKGEEWGQSRVAQWIKNNGTLGSFGGMPCYTVNSVRLMRAADVFAWCDANGMPRHEWLGGNLL